MHNVPSKYLIHSVAHIYKWLYLYAPACRFIFLSLNMIFNSIDKPSKKMNENGKTEYLSEI